MRDIFLDLVNHTNSLKIGSIKVSSSDEETKFLAKIDQSLVMFAKTAVPVKELNGTFGLSDLSTLSYHLKNPEYQKDATITIVEKDEGGVKVPQSMQFVNKNKDFKNEYRFVAKNIINRQVEDVVFSGKDVKWVAEFIPTQLSIDRLKRMTGGLTDTLFFSYKLEDKNLNLYFGDQSTHAGSFTFETLPEGCLKHSFTWVLNHFQSVLDLDGDKRIIMSDQGIMKIEVDSKITKYEFYLLAQQK
jgi:hypothetical protein